MFFYGCQIVNLFGIDFDDFVECFFVVCIVRVVNVVFGVVDKEDVFFIWCKDWLFCYFGLLLGFLVGVC